MNRNNKIALLIGLSLLIIGIGVSTYAYYNSVTTGTSRVNLETKTASQAVISVGNNSSVSLTVLPEDMLEGNQNTYKESSSEETGTLYATVATGSANGQVCTVTVTYQADSEYLFNRSHYCSKDGEANTYGASCAEGYTMHTSSEITDYPEYSVYLTPTVTSGYLETTGGVNTEVDISDINDATSQTIKTYTWKLPASNTNARVDVAIKSRFYNLDFDQNSNTDQTFTANVSLSVYCVGETAALNQTLNRLHLSTADIIKTTPNYVNAPNATNSGLYEIQDDYGTSLAFRGIIYNNWAKFGKENVSSNCTNSGGTKDIMSATGEKITAQATCETTYTYSCSNNTTIFVGTSSTLSVCTTLGLTVSSGNITGTYKSTAVAIEKDIYWRAVRINGDGTLRLIYTGNFAPSSNLSVMTGKWENIGTSVFNSNLWNSAYVGYMYGNIDGTTLDTVHANTNASTIKTVIDNWYINKTNLGTINDEIIADNYFCYDRTIYNGIVGGVDYTLGTGVGKVETAFGATGRLISESSTHAIKPNATPTFICPQGKDMFTKTSISVNNKTTAATGAKIGLLSADEALVAGAAQDGKSPYYLNVGKWFWLGSPFKSSGNAAAYVFYIGSSGGGPWHDCVNEDGSGGVRPVLSVDTTYLTSGNGLATNPWVFEKTNS